MEWPTGSDVWRLILGSGLIGGVAGAVWKRARLRDARSAVASAISDLWNPRRALAHERLKSAQLQVEVRRLERTIRAYTERAELIESLLGSDESLPEEIRNFRQISDDRSKPLITISPTSEDSSTAKSSAPEAIPPTP